MKALIIIALVLVTLIVVPQTLFIVDQTQQAIILQFGRPIRTIQQPGLHVKTPFVQSVTKFEKRILVSDAAPEDYFDADKKRLVVDHITRWRISNPLQFYKSVRDELGALGRLQPIVLSELRDELARDTIAQIIGPEREQIMDTVAERVRHKVAEAELGIEIVDIRIKRADLPIDVQSSIFARMRAERERIAKQYRAEGEERAFLTRATADKEKTIILAEAYEESQKLRGEGDAEATKIYAEAFEQDSEFYAFLRTLEAYQKFLTEKSTLVLGADSELFKYLNSPKPPQPQP